MSNHEMHGVAGRRLRMEDAPKEKQPGKVRSDNQPVNHNQGGEGDKQPTQITEEIDSGDGIQPPQLPAEEEEEEEEKKHPAVEDLKFPALPFGGSSNGIATSPMSPLLSSWPFMADRLRTLFLDVESDEGQPLMMRFFVSPFLSPAETVTLAAVSKDFRGLMLSSGPSFEKWNHEHLRRALVRHFARALELSVVPAATKNATGANHAERVQDSVERVHDSVNNLPALSPEDIRRLVKAANRGSLAGMARSTGMRGYIELSRDLNILAMRVRERWGRWKASRYPVRRLENFLKETPFETFLESGLIWRESTPENVSTLAYPNSTFLA